MIQITGDDFEAFKFDFPVEEFTFIKRLTRAISIFGSLFVCAIVSILIPILHFVLVPIFLMLAIIFGYIRFNQIRSVDLSSLICPKCSVVMNEKKVFLTKKKTSSRLYCFSCRTYMKVEEFDVET